MAASKAILIVDDSDTIREVLNTVLTGAGFEITEASDGRDAISRLGAKRFSLVISDLNMPGMDGLALLGVLKSHPQYRFTPVIMLTSVNDQAKQQEAREAGAIAWLIKPFQPDSLLQAVSMILRS